MRNPIGPSNAPSRNPRPISRCLAERTSAEQNADTYKMQATIVRMDATVKEVLSDLL